MDAVLLRNVALGSLFTVLILLALFGNMMVCIAIVWDRRLRKQSENLFLLSLAISDIGVSVLVMFFAAVNDINQSWIFGPVYCKMWISFDITCCTASILNLAAISLDRYWHISNPMQYIQVMNHRRTAYICLFLWVMSAGLGSVQVLMDRGTNAGQLTGNGSGNATTAPTCVMDLPVWYAIVSSTVSFFLPAAVMVLLYTKLYLYARAHARSIRSQLRAVTGVLMVQPLQPAVRHNEEEADGAAHQLQPPVDQQHPASRRPSACSSHEHSNSTALATKAETLAAKQMMQKEAAKKHKNDNKEASDQKARVTLGVIMGTFLLCWLPFFCCNIISSIIQDFPKDLFATFTWCGYANSSANPIIYSIFNRDFRKAFHRILMKCCEVCSCCARCCKERLQAGASAKRSWARGTPAARYQAGTPASAAPKKSSSRNGIRGGIRVEDGDEEEEPMQLASTPQPPLTTAVTINMVGCEQDTSHSSQSPNGSTHRFKPVQVVATV